MELSSSDLSHSISRNFIFFLIFFFEKKKTERRNKKKEQEKKERKIDPTMVVDKATTGKGRQQWKRSMMAVVTYEVVFVTVVTHKVMFITLGY